MGLLHTQMALASMGLEKLKSEFALNVYEHPTLPLLGLKYTVDSPRTHPITREARGLVLEKDTWKCVAKPFNRFFNVGEVAEEYSKFHWPRFDCIEKVDGSLIVLYNYEGKWLVNTSGSFGLGQAQNFDDSWANLFWKFAQFDKSKLFDEYTYIFELCTPYNRVVKEYAAPTTFLLGVNWLGPNFELTESAVTTVAKEIGANRPIIHQATSEDCVRALMESLEDQDEVHEGVILRDKNNMRYKWKTQKYINLHHLSDNGNVILPKNLTRIVLNGDMDEVLTQRSDLLTALTQVSLSIAKLEDDVFRLFASNAHKSQKEYAMAVKGHKFSWLLFQLRKGASNYGTGWVSAKQIRTILRENYQKVAKGLFPNTTFSFDLS